MTPYQQQYYHQPNDYANEDIEEHNRMMMQ